MNQENIEKINILNALFLINKTEPKIPKSFNLADDRDVNLKIWFLSTTSRTNTRII
jgi:hypothetical protein